MMSADARIIYPDVRIRFLKAAFIVEVPGTHGYLIDWHLLIGVFVFFKPIYNLYKNNEKTRRRMNENKGSFMCPILHKYDIIYSVYRFLSRLHQPIETTEIMSD